LRRPTELIEAGLAPAERRAALAAVAERYAVAITPAVAELIDTADPDDPIARQFIPDPVELMVRPEELADPIGTTFTARWKGSCTAIRTGCC
jgi:lysine 2,3-aminomutase